MDVLLQVLDWIVRVVIVVSLLGGTLLLIVFVWDMAQPEARPSHNKVKRPMVVEMGLVAFFDYSGYGGEFDDRIGHCYMLAAKAMMYSPATDIPAPAGLIHGSWHGPNAANRINHAIVLLDSGDVWEPITAGIYNREKFNQYTRWKREQIYTEGEARDLMLSSGAYGPWPTTT